MSPAQAKAQAQKHVIDAVEQLQNGDEPAARQSVEHALALDPASDLARNLRDQIEADAQKELGSVFFRYTVQRDDSLSKLAQQYLGDRYKFYILAKYNDIANPGRLAAGQVIKIPGKAPIAPPAVAARPARPDPAPEPTVRTPEPEPPATHADAKGLVARSQQLQKDGDLEGAYAAANDATRRDPGNRDAATQREAVRLALVRRYEREAAAAFQRQNLDVAIARWTSVLELDPGNQKARLERERANDLKKRITEKFSK
ncbi:MAG: LysM domain-containing protein [Casimicrobiaceae bacterium]